MAIEYRSVTKFLLLRNIESAGIIHQPQKNYEEEHPASADYVVQFFKSDRQFVFDQEKEG